MKIKNLIGLFGACSAVYFIGFVAGQVIYYLITEGLQYIFPIIGVVTMFYGAFFILTGTDPDDDIMSILKER